MVSLEEVSQLPQTSVGRISDHNVIEHFDLQELPGPDEVTGHFDVRLTGARLPARVIVLCGAPVYVLWSSCHIANTRMNAGVPSP